MKSLITLFTTMLLTMMVALPSAFASHPTDMKIEFKRLEVEMDRGALKLDYTLTKRDWREMKSAGVNPRLNLYTEGRHGRTDFRYSAPITARKGTIFFPREIKPRGAKAVQVAIVGFNGFYHVAQTAYGERCGEKIRVGIERGRGKGHGGHAHHPPAKNAPAANLVKACGNATSSSNVSSCIAKAAAIPRKQRVDVVRACGENTRWDAEFNACLNKAAKLDNFAAAPTIRACGSATQWNSEFNACLTQAAKFRRQPARVIASCDNATQWNSDFNACLANSRPLGRGAASIVDACGEGTRWSSEFHQCVRSAGRARASRHTG